MAETLQDSNQAPVDQNNNQPDVTPELAPPEPLCPRCNHKLMKPETLGWCPSCGYSRALEEEENARKALPAAKTKRGTSPLGILEFVDMLRMPPNWFWVLVAGIAGIAAASFAAGYYLPPFELESSSTKGFPRALLCTVQLFGGILALILVQVWTAFKVARYDDHIGPWSCLISGHLWRAAFNRLPETRLQVWLGAWTLTAAICAPVLIGGMAHWFRYLPKASKEVDPNLRQAAAAKSNKSLEEALKDTAETQKLTEGKKKDDKKDGDTRTSVQCAIIGYTEEEGRVSSFVLATARKGKLIYCGVVREGAGLPETGKAKPDDQKTKEAPPSPNAQSPEEVLRRLPQSVLERPVLPNVPVKAIWVRAEIFCEVQHSGLDKAGLLKEPRVKAFLK